MCVIALKLPEATISDEIIDKCWRANSDGGGFAFSKPREVIIRKGLMKFDDFLAAYRDEESKNPNRLALLHFRIRTHGDTNELNTHPFSVGRGQGAMAHNGMLSGYDSWGYSGKEREGKSDTNNFVMDHGTDMTFDVVTDIKDKLGEYIGNYNKLAFIYPDNDYVIVNERQGSWTKGVWFSNEWWKRK